MLRAQIVQAALATGMIFFGAIVGYLYFKKSPIPSESLAQAAEQIRLFSIFNLIFFIATWSMAPFVRRRILAGKGSYMGHSVDFETDSLEEALCKRWVASQVANLAPREGSGFFGMVICLLGVLNGVIIGSPIFWLNAIPAGMMVLYAFITFPTVNDLSQHLGEFDDGPKVIH